ncbi:ABC transporter ATP-binding protein [Cohnella caldifontis]|uniref:ABC transporter ATP-binding protein n=1 Tax=Cohnella caldifontis TaxID=3027471 RepID=UPI0023EC2CD3|nr:oligopeptide/dipeptide ABC transporter ATP-binding protein [Cohnella sp. YIM B05605]
MSRSHPAILEIDHLKKYYPIQKGFLRRTVGHVKAVDDIRLTIHEGETFGLVGESGCGKSTLGRCLIRAVEPSSGQVAFTDRSGERLNVLSLDNKKLKKLRQEMQMVFQDPFSSLNPRMTVFNIVAEPLVCNGIARGAELVRRVTDLVERVGLERSHLNRYPHAFSGGQRQRIGIARALATNPRFIVCDEAVSALDVSVQAQIINLLQDLQRSLGLSYLFISHDLSVIEHISHRVGVMYVGKMAEIGETEALFAKPLHPYTEALLLSKPAADPAKRKERYVLSGEVANPASPPSGCAFHPRCPYATERCKTDTPALVEVEPDRYSACHYAGELQLQGKRQS